MVAMALRTHRCGGAGEVDECQCERVGGRERGMEKEVGREREGGKEREGGRKREGGREREGEGGR